jgi:hypothetical protein
MDPPAVGGPAQSGIQPGDRYVERRVKVACACLGAYDRAARYAGDLYALAVVGLTRVAFMEQLDIDADDLLVIPLDLGKLVGDVLTVVVRNFDITTLDNNVHA